MKPEQEISELRTRIESMEVLLRAAMRDVNRLSGPFPRIFLAKPDDENAVLWNEQTVAGGEIVEFEDGRKRTDDADDFALMEPASGQVTVMEFTDIAGGNMVKRYVKIGGRPGHFTVDLTSTGGDGTAGDPYVYTATEEGGDVELGTSLTPAKGRIPDTDYTAASKGTGDYDTSGNFRLIEAWETPGTVEACEE